MRILLSCGFAVAVLALGACKRAAMSLDANTPAHRGRYSGIGIYVPDMAWSKLTGVAPDRARLARSPGRPIFMPARLQGVGMIVGLIAMAMLVLRLFPDTPTARFLHRWLAEKPAAWIAGVERKQVIFLLLIVAAVMILREAAPMLAGTSELALFGLWDASVYLDVVMAGWTLAALARGRA